MKVIILLTVLLAEIITAIFLSMSYSTEAIYVPGDKLWPCGAPYYYENYDALHPFGYRRNNIIYTPNPDCDLVHPLTNQMELEWRPSQFFVVLDSLIIMTLVVLAFIIRKKRLTLRS